VNLEARLTPQLAALAAGVSKQTFNYWRTAGKVTPGDDGLYRYGDVLQAESRTRRSPKSHRKPPGAWSALDINSAGLSAAG
jgi:hypothetical protein